MNPDLFLRSLINYELRSGYNYDLAAFERSLKRFGDPHRCIGSVIHIAGTKGKGSVAAMIDSCLRAAGYNVGIYTSPHLQYVNERIKFNGKKISRDDLARYLRLLKPFIKRPDAARTFFEVLTTAAFMYFRDRKCDISILEVGLGGRLDATNVCEPMITIISRIGYDHTNLLGNRLSQIAHEKTGVIKPEVPVITIQQRPAVHKIIASTARARSSPMIIADKNIKTIVKKISIMGTDIEIKGVWGNLKARLGLIGQHQAENLRIALTALYECQKHGFNIGHKALVRGIEKTDLPGRFQVLREKPLVIFDCAHNPDSFKALYENIRTLGLKDFLLIFGCSMHKDINYCIDKIFPLAARAVLVPLNNPRSCSINDLLERTVRFKSKITTAKSVNTALYAALRSGLEDSIIITGSFFLWPYGKNSPKK